MYPGVRLIEDLVRQVPEVEEDYECHLINQGELLPHVFLWDLIGEMSGAMLNDKDWLATWGAVFDFLEARFADGDQEDDSVIDHSFLMNLPYPGSPTYALVAHLGPTLTTRFAQLRPHG